MDYPVPIPTTMSDSGLLMAMYGCLENSDDGFLIVTPDGNIAYINQPYCDYIGVRREEVLGKPVIDYIDTSRLPEIARDPFYGHEVATFHRAAADQYKDHERYVFVNRTNVSREGTPIAGVGQIKFVRNTLKSSATIQQMMDQIEQYEEDLKRINAEKFSINRILGYSDAIRAVKKLAIKSAASDFPILITGETGTGKEIFANAIHYAGSRSHQPIVHINCAAIPADLLESELFGYESGAFTGARKGGKKGKFELADHGTLFLDEIGDMPLNMQAKVLRVIQEGEIEHIGGYKPIPVDVRIICATNRDLEKMIEEGTFRSDLYFRINVLSIKLPPLRERLGDIDLLIDHYLSELNEKYHTEVTMTAEARQILGSYSWPGNVRELKNIIERCYAIQDSGLITSGIIPYSLKKGSTHPVASDAGKSLEEMLADVEREILLGTIRRHQGNLKKSAAELGIHRVTLYKKMDKLGISRSDL